MRTALGALLVLLLNAATSAQDLNKSIFDEDPRFDQLSTAATRPAAQASPAGSPAQGTNPSAEASRKSASGSANPSPAAERLAVPPAAAQQQAIKLTNDLFKTDIARAKTPSEKVALAKRMESVAGTENDSSARYVLLTRARELAADAGDAATACQLLDETAREFELDYSSTKLALFELLARSVSGPKDSAAFVTGMNHWIDQQVWVDHYDVARRAGDLALRVARREDDPSLIADTRRHLKSVEETAAAFGSAKTALAKLRDSPADPDANSAAGKFFCLVKGDWDRGLPLIAKGSDPALKGLAERELAPPATPASREALAEAWWDYGHQKALSPAFQAKAIDRSAHWYRLALPGLGGLQAVVAEKRIADATPAPADATHAPVDATHAPATLAPVDVTRAPVDVTHAPQAVVSVYLSELTETKAEGIVRDGLWDVSKDAMTKSGRPLSVDGVKYQHGIGYNPRLSGGTSRIVYALGGKYRRFTGLVAVNDSGGDFSAVLTFKIVGDGRELWRSKPYKEKKTTEPFDADLLGIDTLELVVDCDGRGQGAHVVWLDPRLELK